MAEEGKRTNLGRGLSALLGEEAADPTESGPSSETNTVPVEFLHPGRYQPRHKIDEAQIKDLTESIREKGILQPILVRRHPDEANIFEIIAGERRWRAAQLAQLHEVPIIVRDFSDREALEVALVEIYNAKTCLRWRRPKATTGLWKNSPTPRSISPKHWARAAATWQIPCGFSACPMRSRRCWMTAAFPPDMRGPYSMPKTR